MTLLQETPAIPAGNVRQGQAGPPVGAPTAPVDARPVQQIFAAVDLSLKIGDADTAEQAARALIGLFPDAIAPSLLLGRALVEQGRWRHAIEHFRWVLACHPLEPGAWAGLAAALAVGGQPREARLALARAALHDPLDSQVLTPGVAALPAEGRGVSYLRQGHDDLARAELARTVADHSDRDDLRLYYVESLRRCGKLDEARRALARLPDDLPPTLPALLLTAALDPAGDSGSSARVRGARFDPDGQLTRRFFAPLRPPWDLLPPPSAVLIDALMPLVTLLDHAPVHAEREARAVGVKSESAAPLPRAAVPSDVREFIATAERLRTRLVMAAGGPQPLLPWSESDRQVHMLLSSRAGLMKRFGADGAAVIDRRLRALADMLQRRGVRAHVAYFDDAESLELDDRTALTPVPAEPAAIARLIRSAAEAIGGAGGELGAVLIVGGPECVPFFRMPNPLPDDDRELLTDLPYAAADDADLAPRLILARVPDGGRLELLLEQLDRMLARHSGRPRGPLARLRHGQPHEPGQGAWAPAAGYAAEVWREPARAILDTLHPPAELLLCPPAEARSLDPGELLGTSVAYVNLHGATGRTSWYGQPDDWNGAATRLPVALRPDQLAGRCVSGGLLVSEACYGIELAGRTPSTSIPLRALHEGIAAVVGSTVSAYGSYTTPLVGGDLLCERLMAHLAAGLPVGAALCQARAEFAQTMYRRQGYLDEVDRKTLLSFALCGDPWATVAPATPVARRWAPARVLGMSRASRPRSSAPVDERQVPRELLQKVRTTLRKVLPGAADVHLAISARVDRQLSLKGDAPADLVFTARESLATEDGAVIGQAAHITVSRSAVVKVALTR